MGRFRALGDLAGWARALSLVLLVAGLIGCRGDDDLLVFGAASLADALQATGEAWEERHPDAPVAFNFAGSNDLARQVAAGAPADLFVSADRGRLEAAERVDLAAAVPLLANRLVVIVPDGAGAGGRDVEVRAPADLLAFDRIALPDPHAVPAGIYARRWLAAEGLWDELASRVVPALDARANLAAVASGGLPAGVVYATDAAVSDRVEVVYRVQGPPQGAGPEIVYWAAPVAGGRRRVAGRFLEHLGSPEAGAVFRRFGFEHLPTAGSTGRGSLP